MLSMSKLKCFLFGLVLYVPVNSYGHVRTVTSPYHTFYWAFWYFSLKSCILRCGKTSKRGFFWVYITPDGYLQNLLYTRGVFEYPYHMTYYIKHEMVLLSKLYTCGGSFGYTLYMRWLFWVPITHGMVILSTHYTWECTFEYTLYMRRFF